MRSTGNFQPLDSNSFSHPPIFSNDATPQRILLRLGVVPCVTCMKLNFYLICNLDSKVAISKEIMAFVLPLTLLIATN